MTARKARKLSWTRIFSQRSEPKPESCATSTWNSPMVEADPFRSRRNSEPWVKEMNQMTNLRFDSTPTPSDPLQTPVTSISSFGHQQPEFCDPRSSSLPDGSGSRAFCRSSIYESRFTQLQEDAQRWLESLASKNQEARARFQAKANKNSKSLKTSNELNGTGLSPPRSAPPSNQAFSNKRSLRARSNTGSSQEDFSLVEDDDDDQDKEIESSFTAKDYNQLGEGFTREYFKNAANSEVNSSPTQKFSSIAGLEAGASGRFHRLVSTWSADTLSLLSGSKEDNCDSEISNDHDFFLNEEMEG